MLLDALSLPLTKALQQGNSVATSFQTLGLQTVIPSADGVIAWGQQTVAGFPQSGEGMIAAPRLFLLPYGDGAIGSQFSVRVYGWRPVNVPGSSLSQVVWYPVFLAEFLCTVADLPGPAGIGQGAGSPPFQLDSERCCDTISLTQGFLGASSPGGGFINSTGPGTNLLASACIEPQGAKLVQFDFQNAETGNQVGMNCMWARA